MLHNNFMIEKFRQIDRVILEEITYAPVQCFHQNSIVRSSQFLIYTNYLDVFKIRQLDLLCWKFKFQPSKTGK